MTVWTDVINEFRENQGGECVEFASFPSPVVAGADGGAEQCFDLLGPAGGRYRGACDAGDVEEESGTFLLSFFLSSFLVAA